MRASLAALAALLLAAAPPAGASMFGRSSAKKALLWVPDQASLDWEALRVLLESRPRARLTIALSPGDIPESARPWLVELSSNSRVEVALRLPGDPILPVLHRFRPRDFPDRLALGRSQYKQVFGDHPAGFVPGAGALTPALAQPLAKSGFEWTAAGDDALRSPWYTPDNMVVVPFHSPASAGSADFPPPEGGCAAVIDEGGGPFAPGGGLDALRRLFSEDEDAWTTVADALEDLSPYASGPEVWPGWEGELDAWTSAPSQKRAWDLYARTVGALQRYEDSGAARLNTLNQATQSLYSAQASRFYRSGGPSDPRVDKEFQGLLHRVFRLIGQPPPKGLSKPAAAASKSKGPKKLSPSAGDDSGPDEGAPAGEEGSWRVRSGAEGRSLWFENPTDGAAEDAWTPRRLDVRWDEKGVSFVFGMGRADGAGKAAGGGQLLLDLYMDINHLAGRGSTDLLPGRRGFMMPRDGWEFALVLTGSTGALYRSNPGQSPALVASLRPQTDPRSGETRVVVPRSALRGNPAGWGYLFLTMATDRARAEASPPAPLSREGRSLLGLMGPLQAQTALRKASEGDYQRFSALRVDE